MSSERYFMFMNMQ